MNTKLILLFLLLNGFAFGQSAKKLNKQLQLELLLATKEQDSVYQLFFEERKVLEKRREALEDHIGFLHSGELIFQQISKSITQSLFTLSQLEIPTKDVLPQGFNSEAFSNASNFIKQYEDALHKAVLFRYISLDPSFFEGANWDERNVLLQENISDYGVAMKENESAFQDLRVYTRQLAELEHRLDSLRNKYKLEIAELEQIVPLLTQRVKDARENYRQNGPEGFSKAYHEQFPAIHPRPEMGNKYPNGVEYRSEEPVTLLEEPAPKVFMVTDEPAQYPDGRLALMNYMKHHLIYPESLKDKRFSGKVFVRFVVSETGEISQVEVLKGIAECPECNDAVISMIEAMPRWIPAKEKGKAVNSWYNLPISFKL